MRVDQIFETISLSSVNSRSLKLTRFDPNQKPNVSSTIVKIIRPEITAVFTQQVYVFKYLSIDEILLRCS